MLLVPSTKTIVIVTVILIISMIYSTSCIFSYKIIWNTEILSDNTNYDIRNNDEKNNLIIVCKKKAQVFSISFIGELVLLYGIFVNYISCIKKSVFSKITLYISIIFYIITIIIVFAIIKYNNCLEYYKDNIGTYIFYKLLIIKYISCTSIFAILSFDYIISLFLKYYKQRRRIQNRNIQTLETETETSDDELLTEI